MLPAAFHRLTAVSAGFRGADQLMVAGTPLVVAALFGGGPAAARRLASLTRESPAWEARGFRQLAAARWGALLRAAVTGRHGKRLVTGRQDRAPAGERGTALACHPPALGGRHAGGA